MVDNAARERIEQRRVGAAEQGARVALGQEAARQKLARDRRQGEQTQTIGNRHPAAADTTRYLLLSEPAINQELIRVRLLEGRQIGALQIFDECELEGGLGRCVLYDRWYSRQTGRLRRPPAPLARHDAVAITGASHHERLEQPVLPYGSSQLLERLGVEPLSWLLRIGRDAIDFYVLKPACAAWDERVQPAAQAAPRLAHGP